MIEIPYELIERLFGPFIAQNFNKICYLLLIIGLCYRLFGKKLSPERKIKYKKLPQEDTDLPKWSPTGWYWDKKKGKWIAPDYVSEESERQWKWDEEKRIWIDLSQAEKEVKYREFRKGKEPTFEEWKASREASQTSDSESVQ